jgi:uncharacterized protein YndB with AHSA1/START domain
MVPDKIEREIVIDAPVERVWSVVTEAQHIGRWFGDVGAEIDLRPGGAFRCSWDKYGTVHGVKRTRLRVVESGFRELAGTDAERAKYAHENTGGWESELAELAAYTTQGVVV